MSHREFSARRPWSAPSCSWQRAMGLGTTAECIESDGIKAVVAGLGVDFGQGYALGRPRPLDQVLQELRERPAARTCSPRCPTSFGSGRRLRASASSPAQCWRRCVYHARLFGQLTPSTRWIRRHRVQAASRLTGRTLLFLELLGIVLGAATFAIDPLNFIHPWLAVAGVLWMACATLLVRVVPWFRLHEARCPPLRDRCALRLRSAADGIYGRNQQSLPVLLCPARRRQRPAVEALAGAAARGGNRVVTLVQSGLLDPMNDMYFLTTAAVVAECPCTGVRWLHWSLRACGARWASRNSESPNCCDRRA